MTEMLTKTSGMVIMMARGVEKMLLQRNPMSDRIIVARFNSGHIKLSMIHIYALTNKAELEAKADFCEQLQETLNNLLTTCPEPVQCGGTCWRHEASTDIASGVFVARKLPHHVKVRAS